MIKLNQLIKRELKHDFKVYYYDTEAQTPVEHLDDLLPREQTCDEFFDAYNIPVSDEERKRMFETNFNQYMAKYMPKLNNYLKQVKLIQSKMTNHYSDKLINQLHKVLAKYSKLLN